MKEYGRRPRYLSDTQRAEELNGVSSSPDKRLEKFLQVQRQEKCLLEEQEGAAIEIGSEPHFSTLFFPCFFHVLV